MLKHRGMNRLALLLAAVLPLAASAYELRKDSTGASVHWKNGVTFVMDARLPAQVEEPAALDAVLAAVASVLRLAVRQ